MSIISLGIDFGSTTCRAMILNLNTNQQFVGTSDYQCGTEGVMEDANNDLVARQSPLAYLKAMEAAVNSAIHKAKEEGIDCTKIAAISTATTGSTPLPVDQNLQPLVLQEKFKDNLNAQAWMWKDHSSYQEADDITNFAKQNYPSYLTKCGGAYSSEWFFSKILRCARVDSEVFEAAHTWLEFSDFIPAQLAGITKNSELKRNACAAGHKAMFNTEWGGLPEKAMLEGVENGFSAILDNLYTSVNSVGEQVGGLSQEWADKWGLTAGTPIIVGMLDAHMGAIGAGVSENTCVRIIGTSSCDIMVHPMGTPLNEIVGVSGVADESVLPNCVGVEAGQSAVGDIFNWYVKNILKRSNDAHKELTEKAKQLRIGESGLLALDWNNGNRNILTDPQLSGLILGQTLKTEDYEIYRALIEASAFGAKVIFDTIENSGLRIKTVINCGGISKKNELFMQVLADVLNKPMFVSAIDETVALGACLVAASYASQSTDQKISIPELQERICKLEKENYFPIQKNVNQYKTLFSLYKQLHDSFGVKGNHSDHYHIMKNLLKLKNN